MSLSVQQSPEVAGSGESVPQVPEQLGHYLEQPDTLSALTSGQETRVADYLAVASERVYFEDINPTGGKDYESSAVAIKPGKNPAARFGTDDSQASVLFLPYGQRFSKPSMQVRAEMMHRVNSFDRDLIVVDGVSGERSAMELGENTARVLEQLGYDEYDLTGYSLGSLTVLATLNAGSDKFDVKRANVDELPFGETPIKDRFNDPSAYFKQLRAIKASKNRAIRQALNPVRLTADYARFAKFAFVTEEGRNMREAMEGTHDEIIEGAASQGVKIKLGATANKSIFDTELFDKSFGGNHSLFRVDYTGASTEGHTLADNIAAHALMVKHGFDLSGSN